MNNGNNPKIFLSYSWVNKGKAEEIDYDFKCIGIKLTRDVRDLIYGRHIKEFTQSIMDHDYVLTVISDAFLKSEHCMEEIFVILNSHRNKVGLLPIILDDATHILKHEGRTSYYTYWKEQYNEAVRNHGIFQNQDSLNRQKTYNNINNSIDSFLTEVAEKKNLLLSELKSDGYKQLLDIIGFNDEAISDAVLAITNITDAALKTAAINNFLEQHEGTANGEFFQAYFILDRDDYQTAWVLYNEYINKYKNSFASRLGSAYNNLGYILRQYCDDYQNAAVYYADAIKHYVPKKKPAGHNVLGLLYQNHLNDNNLAKYHFEEALKIDRSYIPARINLALLLQNNLKNYEEAARQFTEIIRLDPNNSVHYDLALLLQNHLGDFNGAKQQFLEVIRLYPHASNVPFELAALFDNKLKDYENAKFYYNQTVLLDPNHADAHFDLATLLQNHFNNPLQALYHYQQVLRINPASSIVHNNMGIIYYKNLHDLVKAKYHFQQAVRIDPNNQVARKNLALVAKLK